MVKLRKGGPFAKPTLGTTEAFKRQVKAVKANVQKKPAAHVPTKRHHTVFTKKRVRALVTQGVRQTIYKAAVKRPAAAV